MSETVVTPVDNVFPYYTLSFAELNTPGNNTGGLKYTFQVRIMADPSSGGSSDPGWTDALEGYLTGMAEYLTTLNSVYVFTGSPGLAKTDVASSSVWSQA